MLVFRLIEKKYRVVNMPKHNKPPVILPMFLAMQMIHLATEPMKPVIAEIKDEEAAALERAARRAANRPKTIDDLSDKEIMDKLNDQAKSSGILRQLQNVERIRNLLSREETLKPAIVLELCKRVTANQDLAAGEYITYFRNKGLLSELYKKTKTQSLKERIIAAMDYEQIVSLFEELADSYVGEDSKGELFSYLSAGRIKKFFLVAEMNANFAHYLGLAKIQAVLRECEEEEQEDFIDILSSFQIRALIGLPKFESRVDILIRLNVENALELLESARTNSAIKLSIVQNHEKLRTWLTSLTSDQQSRFDFFVSKITKEQLAQLFIACDDDQRSILVNKLCQNLSLEAKKDLFLAITNIELRKSIIKSGFTPDQVTSFLITHPAVQDQILASCSDRKLEAIHVSLEAGLLKNKVLSMTSKDYIYSVYLMQTPSEKQVIIRSLTARKLNILYQANDDKFFKESIISAATSEQFKDLLASDFIDDSFKALILKALLIRGEDGSGQVQSGFSASFKRELFNLVPIRVAIKIIDPDSLAFVGNINSIIDEMCMVYGRRWLIEVIEEGSVQSKSYILQNIMTNQEILSTFVDIKNAYARDPQRGENINREMFNILGSNKVYQLLTLANDVEFKLMSDILKSHNYLAHVTKSIEENKDKHTLNRLIGMIEKAELFDRTSFANQFVLKKLRSVKLEADGHGFISDADGANHYNGKIAFARIIKATLDDRLGAQLKIYPEIAAKDFSMVVLSVIAAQCNSFDIYDSKRKLYTTGGTYTIEQKEIALGIAESLIKCAKEKEARSLLVKCLDLIVSLVDSLLRPHKTWVAGVEKDILTSIMQGKHALRDRTPGTELSVGQATSTQAVLGQPSEDFLPKRMEKELERRQIKMAAPSPEVGI